MKSEVVSDTSVPTLHGFSTVYGEVCDYRHRQNPSCKGMEHEHVQLNRTNRRWMKGK